MSANEHIEELLSGFLDGELTAGELAELEFAMSADSTLAVKLEQLRQLGSDLRSVPKRKLDAGFASRVLAAARQEALASDSVDSQFVCKEQTIPVRGWRWCAVGTAALAASLLLGFYVWNWFPAGVSIPGAGEVVVDPPVDPEPNPNELLPENGNEGDSTWVRNGPPKKHFQVLPIFEIGTSPKAWKTNEIGTILLNEGIVWTRPVVATDEVINVLNETRSINPSLPKPDDEQVALVMVRASGRAIDKAMLRIYARPNDFPNVLMDLAFDMPGLELFEKVVGPAVATPIGGRAAEAETAPVRDLESVSQFSRASSAKPTQPPLAFQSGDMSAEDEISYVLLVIRKPTE